MVKLREREELAARELEARHVMISRPGEGHPESGLLNCWGVFVGSHGGYAKTLRVAMARCLRCCGIGPWWKVDFGEGELLATLCARVCDTHSLGEMNYRMPAARPAIAATPASVRR